MIGSLIHEDYMKLFVSKKIISPFLNHDQIQPASLDLTLSDECYEIKYSFVCHDSTVRKKLHKLAKKKIDLKNQFLFEKNKTYIVRLNEKLNLSNNMFGHCNPKSTTGRLDIFCRTIVDYTDEYEKIPANYNGEIFLEITSRSFNILLQSGDRLNQLRLIYSDHQYYSDYELSILHNSHRIIFENDNIKIENGLKISANLKETNNPVAYSAKLNAPNINFNKINFHKIEDFWNPLHSESNSLIIEKDKFYILRSKEKISIPPFLAGEMVPYDTGIGDFRAHYAGFFDPGFGDPNGSYAVLEVKTNELSFLLEDGQTIARIKYEKLNKKSNVVYGSKIKSNYQNQGLKLSKHFY
tara:strand:- start:481 stop:1539 length:1059 start_codon:yes stop_codon:yes gene_type:complete